jgi:hypothetical protein
MKVMIIPEDFRKDQFILKPVFDRLFVALNCSTARVRVCMAPLLQGVSEAMKFDRLTDIVDRYPMVDLFILWVDRDGNKGRRHQLDSLEKRIVTSARFLAVNAWEEIETWVLAGIDLPAKWRWNDVRAEISVKERYFEPLARERGVADGPGGGRKILAEEAARRLPSVRQKCPDDFEHLAQRLAQVL